MTLRLLLAVMIGIACAACASTGPQKRPALSKQQVVEGIRLVHPRVKSCAGTKDWNAGLRQGRSGKFELQTRFLVQPDGRTSNIEIVSAGGSDAFRSCVAAALKVARFQTFRGTAFPVSFPFAF